MNTEASFDLLGPLPSGTVVLEASAGTGKTYTIAALATRYVAEVGVPLAQLMLVTFGRAATQELRERTRQRLAEAARGLDDVAAARSGADALIAHLAAGTPAEVAERRRRLLVALSDFDAATITTTHSFCQRMLDSLGIAGDREPGARIVEAVDDVIGEVAGDLFLRTYADPAAPVPRLTPAVARQVAAEALADRQARLAPADHLADTEAGQRVTLAEQARIEVDRRKRTAGIRDFDDLLVLLRDALAHPDHGAASCARIRERYRVVLVDEFQDTDPVQWEVLRRAFAGHTTLVLIGDPKQAIYAFRGAEVLSYLDAVRLADRHETLGVNWRTDAGLLTALDHLYGGAALGHPQIVVHPVRAAHARPRLPGLTPLRLRWLDRTNAGPLNTKGFPSVEVLRRRVGADLADDVARLLDSGRVAPGDVAVLVRNRRHVEAVRPALDRAAIPSVLASSTSVFATAAASDWLWFLQAMEAPQRPDRVRLAALTSLLGHRAENLGEPATTETSLLLRELARLFTDAGPAAVFERLATRTDLDARLLGEAGGERRLTDVRHVAQLLNRAAVQESFGLSALTTWLAERISNPNSGSAGERSRRLESDAAAVHIVTVHTSKGLEFPVVYVPFGWDGAKNPHPNSLLLHDDDGHRIRDVGGPGDPGYALRQRRSESEEAGEELRLLYVALTRARSQLVTWWAPSAGTPPSPLHRLLFGRTPDSAEPLPRPRVPGDAQLAQAFADWAGGAAGLVAVEPVGPAEGRSWTPPQDHPPQLEVARFTRSVDLLWRRTSYSALTAAAHQGAGVGSEPEQPELTDEPVDAGLDDTLVQLAALADHTATLVEGPAAPGDPATGGPAGGDPARVDLAGVHLAGVDLAGVDLAGVDLAGDDLAGDDLPSPMNGLPSGPVFGTLVHEVFELCDPGAPALAAELAEHCRQVVTTRLADLDPEALSAALLPVFATPLLADGTTLATIAVKDRLAELNFELPLAGGDCPHQLKVTLSQVAALMRKHLPPDDALAGYPDLLQTVEATPLRGFLTGSIDAVLRLPGPRYVVVDYKTNRLGRGDLTTAHYTREAMTAEMLQAHYPLQALLYGVALHRYLRWRQPGYTPQQHLGPILYLFVRGMAGPATPPGCGVFDWQPPSTLIPELSDLLAGGPS